MNKLHMASVVYLVTFLVACSDSGNNSGTDDSADAQYRVSFNAVWNGAGFPTNYPGSAHFSGLVGATHNSAKTFWNIKEAASPGVKSVAETGSKSTFRGEINTSISAGDADYLLDGGGIGTGSGDVSLDFSINESHSLVTLISMIAPSPDWFVGVYDLELYDSTASDWKPSVIVDLKAYDAGTDDGSQFTSSNAVTSPVGDIELLTSDPGTDFTDGVNRATMQHIGTFTFVRL